MNFGCVGHRPNVILAGETGYLLIKVCSLMVVNFCDVTAVVDLEPCVRQSVLRLQVQLVYVYRVVVQDSNTLRLVR